MKQFNVHDETHKFGRLLSAQTNKSLLVIIQEALELYAKSLEGEETEVSESVILEKACNTVVARLCVVIHEEVPRVLTEMVRMREELRQQQAKEFERALREATPEAPEDDLEERTYEEVYGRTETDGSVVE